MSELPWPAKTLFLFLEFEETFFFEVEGNFKKFNNVYIGSVSDDKSLQQELNDLVYDENGGRKVKVLDEPTTDWTYFVKAGIL